MFIRHLLLALLFLAINYKFFYLTYLEKGVERCLYGVLVYFVIFLFVTYLFSFNRILNRLWLILLFSLSLSSVYFVNTMGIEFNKEIIKNIVNTNFSETIELLGIPFFIYFFGVLALLFGIYRFGIAPLKKVSIKPYLVTIVALVALFFSITKIDEADYRKIIHDDTKKIVPIAIFPALGNYLRTKSREGEIVKKNISNHFRYTKKEDRPIIAVLVIGESARADRFAINGYNRNTTPNLSKTRGVVSFEHASSCDTSTLSSVPCLLLRVGHEKFKFPVQESGFVQVFTDHGFNTYWLTLQHEANTIHTFCKEAKECIDLSSMQYDMDLFEKFKDIVQSARKDTLIVVHTMGSHMDYNKRVPKEYRKFQPICTDAYVECKDELDNSYDNTIYYTDHFLSGMINTLREKKAFLLYVSDHGESLGEKYLGLFRRYGHASPYDVAPEAQTHIPFIAWFSKIFRTDKPQVDHIERRKRVSHDFIFSSMLGCAGFIGDYIDPELNLCQ